MMSIAFASAFAQSPAGGQTQPANPLMSLMPIILIFLIFYFLIIRPQQQKQKEHARLLSALKKNDRVVTQGGVHGTIVNVKDKTIVIRVDDNVRIEVEKYAVSRVLNGD